MTTGVYASTKSPRRPPFALVLVAIAAAVVAVLAFMNRQSSADQTPSSAVAELSAQITQLEAENEALRARLAAVSHEAPEEIAGDATSSDDDGDGFSSALKVEMARAEAEDLEKRNAELERQVAELGAYHADCMSGLDKAVAQLNTEIQRNAAASGSHRASSSGSRSSYNPHRYVVVHQPHSSVADNGTIDVEGDVFNAASKQVRGYVVVTASAAGRQIEREVSLTIAPGVRETYRVQIRSPFAAHGANVRISASWSKR